MGVEQRRHPRHEIALPVSFHYAGESHSVSSVNVSVGGMLVEMDDPPPREESLTFSVELKDPDTDQVRELRFFGTVVHLGASGFGIRFDRVNDFEEEMALLEAFLAVHE